MHQLATAGSVAFPTASPCNLAQSATSGSRTSRASSFRPSLLRVAPSAHRTWRRFSVVWSVSLGPLNEDLLKYVQGLTIATLGIESAPQRVLSIDYREGSFPEPSAMLCQDFFVRLSHRLDSTMTDEPGINPVIPVPNAIRHSDKCPIRRPTKRYNGRFLAPVRRDGAGSALRARPNRGNMD